MPLTDQSITMAAGRDLYTGSLVPPAQLTFAMDDAALVGTPAAASITNSSATPSGPWSIPSVAGLSFSPSSGASIAAGATQNIMVTATTAGSKSATLVCAGAIISGSPQVMAVTNPAILAITFTADDTGRVGTAAAGLLQNTGNTDLPWSITPPSGISVSPSSGTLAAGATQALAITPSALGTYSLTLVCAGATITGNPQSLVAGPALATALTVSFSSTGVTGVPVTVTVTPNGPIGTAGTSTLAASNGGVLGATSFSWAAGQTSSQSTTLNRTTDGSSVITLTNSMGLANAGSGATYTSSGIPAPAAGSPQVTLTSATINTLPFAVGFAFRQGDIPSGQSVVVSGAAARAAILSRWPDGSAKFAIIGGTYTSAGSGVTATMSAGSVSPGATLTAANLQTAMGASTAVITAATAGTVTWSGSDWASPLSTDAATDLFARFTFRKPIGSDAHLVAWLEVTLFASGAIEVLPYVENGYFLVTGPTLKTDTFSFALGGTTRFGATSISLPHHTRTPLVSGTALSHWLGTDPGVTPQHDKAYLQSTELVPTFDVTTSSLSVGYTVKATSYTPLQQGDYVFGPDQTDAMTNTGYSEPIGLLPGWDVKYLTCTSALNAAAYGAVIRNGYSAGRYPIHYRDASTNVPPRWSTYPMYALWSPGTNGSGFASQGGTATSQYTPAIIDATGTKTWDTAHSPAVGFLPYLLTGRRYFMEECQFAAGINFFGMDAGSTQRGGASGIHRPDLGAWQLRSAAWGLRALGHALCVTPDADTSGLRADYKTSMQANVDYWHGRHVAQSSDPLGYIIAWNNVGGVGYGDPWQHDFMTGVVGYTLSMGLPFDTGYQAKWAAFLGYTAKSIIGRLGLLSSATDWPMVSGFQYQIPIYPSGGGDYATGAGPWYANHRAAYTAFLATSPTVVGTSEGTIVLEFPNPNDAARGFFANAQPAISYAVRHGVTGARAAYSRLVGALNFWGMRPGFETYPLWAQRPATGMLPAYMSSATAGTFMQISGTTSPTSALNDYSGFALTSYGKLAFGAQGGHAGSRDNRACVLDLLADAPAWSTIIAASPTAPDDVAYNPDGKPASRHGYCSTIYAPAIKRVLLVGVRYTTPGANTFDKVDGFDPDGTAWDGIVAGSPGTSGSGYAAAPNYGAVLDGNGNIWTYQGTGKYNVTGNSWTTPVTQNTNNVRYPWCWDSRRGQLFGLCFGDGEGFNASIRALVQTPSATSQTVISFNASSAYTQLQADAPTYAAMTYDPINDRFLFYSGDHSTRVYVITPNSGTTWDVSLLTMSGTALPTTLRPAVGKMHFVPQLRSVVMQPDANSNIYVLPVG